MQKAYADLINVHDFKARFALKYLIIPDECHPLSKSPTTGKSFLSINI